MFSNRGKASAGVVIVLALLTAHSAAAVDLNSGDILVADQSGLIIHVDPVTGTQTTVSSGGSFVEPMGITIDANGQILVTDRHAFGGNGGVIRVDPVTGTQTTVSSGGQFIDPFGIAVETSGDIVVADPTAGQVIRVDPTIPDDSMGGNQTIVSSGDLFVDPVGIAVHLNGYLYVVDQNAFESGPCPAPGGVIRVDPGTGSQVILSAGGNFEEPNSITIDENGKIVVGEAEHCTDAAGIIRVDPVTGGQTTVSSGGTLNKPHGVAVDIAGDILVTVTVGPTDGVVRVDPLTGVQTIVSSGGNFVSPVGITIVPPPPPIPALSMRGLATFLLLAAGAMLIIGRRLSLS